MVGWPSRPFLERILNDGNTPPVCFENTTVFLFVKENQEGLLESLGTWAGDTHGARSAMVCTVARDPTPTGYNNGWTVPGAVFWSRHLMM